MTNMSSRADKAEPGVSRVCQNFGHCASRRQAWNPRALGDEVLWMGGFRVLPSLGSCNKETLASRDCALPTWRPSPGTLGHGEGNVESHGSWPQQDASQLSSRRRGAARRPAGMRPLSLEAALQSLRQLALRGPGASAPGGRRTFPSLLSRLSPEAFIGQHREDALQVHGFAAAAVSASGSLLPRLPLPAFGWTSPVCAPCGEGLQVLPALALES